MRCTRPTTLLASRDETVVAEDRNVTGRLHNRRLAQSRSDRFLERVRQPLGSKTIWRGGRLLAERFFPSSKTCSAWGTVNAKRSLAERV
jgi:putative transposase